MQSCDTIQTSGNAHVYVIFGLTCTLVNNLLYRLLYWPER